MKTIPEVLIQQTWQRLSSMSPAQAKPVLEHWASAQPAVMGCALSLEDEAGDNERGKFMFLAVVVREIRRLGEG